MEGKDQLAEIWQDACARYTTITGVDLQTNSSVIRATSAEDLMLMLEERQAQFSKFRERKAALWKVLGQTARGVEITASIASDGISMVFPPSGVIFAAVGYLIQAAKNVGSAYDSIIKVLEVLKVFITCLNLHTRHAILPELRDIFVRKLSCLLVVLGLSAKMIREGRALRFVKNILQGSDGSGMQSQIDELETLSKHEADLIRTLGLTSLYEQSAALTSLAKDVSANKSALEELVSMQSHKNAGDDVEAQLRVLKELLNPELSIQTDFDNIANDLLPGTGDWILSHSSFRGWLDDDSSSCLWISGGPGHGKSYLSARIIKHLRELYPQEVEYTSRTSVAFFFCRDSNKRTQMFSVILRSLAYQVARNDNVYLSYLMNALEDDINSVAGTARAWDVMFGNFFGGKNTKSRAFIIIDGLDEAIREGFEGVETFLESFRLFLLSQRNSSSRLKVLLVGRPLLDDMIYDVLGLLATPIALSTSHESDVVKYVKNQLAHARNLRRVSPEFRDEMLQKLSERTFLWVKLVCKEIASRNRESQMRTALDAFPQDLGATIRHVLERFSETNAEEIDDLNELLVWVTCALRPLTLGEMEIVMAMNSPTYEPVLELERLLRKHYSTFFTLSRKDGLGTVDLQLQARGLSGRTIQDSPHETTDELATALQEGESDNADDLEEDIDVFESPKDTTVHISHLVFLEYFRSQGSKNTPVGVDIAKAEIHILICCLSLISDEDKAAKWGNETLMGYARARWMPHLRGADFSAASSEERHEVATRLHRMFTHQDTFVRWLGLTVSASIALEIFETAGTTDAIVRWTSDSDEPEEVRLWHDMISTDLNELVAEIPKIFAAKWLYDDSEWEPFECFRVIYAYIAKFGLGSKEGQSLKSGPASKFVEYDRNASIAYDDILTVIDWIDVPEDPSAVARVARLLRNIADYDHALEWYHKAADVMPQSYPAICGLARTYGLQADYMKAVEWGQRGLACPEGPEERQVDVAQLAHDIAQWISDAVSQRSDQFNEDDALRAWDVAFARNPKNAQFVLAYLEQLADWRRYEKYVSVLQGLREVDGNSTQVEEGTHDFLIECVHQQAGSFELQSLQKAARNMRVIRWLVSLYTSAIDAAVLLHERSKTPGLVAGLQFMLAAVYQFDVDGGEEKAVELYEAGLADLTTSKTSSPFFTLRGLAITNLSKIYFQRAIAASEQGKDFEPHIAALSRTVHGQYCAVPEDDEDAPEVEYQPLFEYLISWVHSAALLLGLWHRSRGEHDKARPYFKGRISAAFDILDDDIEANDGEGYMFLSDALRMAGDLRGAKAAIHLIGGLSIDEALRVWPNETEDSDYDPAYKIPRVKGGDVDAVMLTLGLYSECNGPCDRMMYIPHGIHVCYTCLDGTFCAPCLGKLKRGKLQYKVSCSKDHQWFYVSRQHMPDIPEGKVVFVAEGDQDQELVDMKDWFAELKQKWGIENLRE